VIAMSSDVPQHAGEDVTPLSLNDSNLVIQSSTKLKSLATAGPEAGPSKRIRLPDALVEQGIFASSTGAKKACRRGLVLLNGGQRGRVDTLVGSEDTVHVLARIAATHFGQKRDESSAKVENGATSDQESSMDVSPTPSGFRTVPEHVLDVQLALLYEDDHIAVVVKPRGMPVQGRGLGRETVKTALMNLLSPSKAIGILNRPHHVHRIDAPTGGLLVAAKTNVALQELSRAFADREVKKRYLAVCDGRLEGKGSVDRPLQGAHAYTEYDVIQTKRRDDGTWISLVRLSPHTGRQHQLRRHMQSLGHPIVGDTRYGNRRTRVKTDGRGPPGEVESNGETEPGSDQHRAQDAQSLFLWASALTLRHPTTKQAYTFAVEPPSAFSELLR